MLPAGVAYVGCADRRCRRRRDSAPRRRARGRSPRHALLLVAMRRPAGRRARRRAARHLAVPVAAARAARPARQRDDPREGADARARALRGLRVLRQADARAARGLEPAAVAGDAHLRPGAERDLAGELRHAARRTSRRGRSRCCVLAGLPAFVAEAKFSGDAFRLFRWRSPETRMQLYLETVLAREDHAKEVKLFGLGPLFLERYRDDLPQAVPRGPRPHDPPRHAGASCSGSIAHRRVLRRVRVDRARDDRARASRSAR